MRLVFWSTACNIRLMNIARPESKQGRQILRSAASVVFGSGDHWNFAAHKCGARVERGTVGTETVKLESMLCPVRGLEILISQPRSSRVRYRQRPMRLIEGAPQLEKAARLPRLVAQPHRTDCQQVDEKSLRDNTR